MPSLTALDRRPLALAVLAALNSVPAAQAASPNGPSASVVISQIYGGGGNSGAPFRNDFVELFNRSTSAVDLTGWSLQYTSAAGSSWGSQKTGLSGILEPGRYLLVQMASGGATGNPLPAADIAGSTNLSATAGKLALVNGGASLPAVACPSDASIVDLVGYGSTANCFEGATAAPAPSNTSAVIRAGQGCTDTDGNGTDLMLGTPAPRNSATAAATCAGATLANISVQATDPIAAESGRDSGSLTITRSGDLTTDLTVNYTLGGSASAADYAPLLGGSVVLPAGESAVVVSVTPIDDSDPEGPETLVLTLTPGSGYGLGASTSATITLIDDDLPACTTPDTPIGVVQGAGSTSPLVGQTVTVQGVVIGDYEYPGTGSSSDYLRGFYLENTAAESDGDPTTSDGIFIFNGNRNSVQLGQVIQVTGTVSEWGFNSAGGTQTQITPTANGIEQCGGTAGIDPVDLFLPFADPAAPERHEGMLVHFPQRLMVTEHYQLGRFGQVLLSSGDRLLQPTQVVAPGAEAAARQAQNDLDQIMLDDDLQLQNPDPIKFGRGAAPLSATNTLRGGDTLTGVTGVLTETDATAAANVSATADPVIYRLRPVGDLSDLSDPSLPDFQPGNPRPEGPPQLGGRLKVVGMNVLNYFLTLDVGTRANCGPSGHKQECRGAETALELQRQRTKLLAALLKLDADIFALAELENSETADGVPVEVVRDLCDHLNAATAEGTYRYLDTGIIGTDTIRVGMLYKPAKVTPIGPFQVDSDPVHNRPPLAQLFEENATSARFKLVMNHFKSKGSCPAPGDADFAGNDDSGDGQGCWNRKRTEQAQRILAFAPLAPDSDSFDPDVLVLGDLNAYAKEDPIERFLEAGYTDLNRHTGGKPGYSYVFDGQWGTLDYALASPSLVSQISAAADYHINADEPSVLDYNTNFKSTGQIGSLYNGDEFRTSDHDPVVVGLSPTLNPIRGDAAPNTLTGTGGGDLITGFAGRDTLTGRGGRDVFVYGSVGDGIDIITDFTPGSDRIALTGLVQALRIRSSDPIGEGYVTCRAQGSASLIGIDPDGAAGTALTRPLLQVNGIACPTLLQPTHFTF